MHDYPNIGALANADQVRTLVHHLLRSNDRAASADQPQYPLCIWGAPGIGKTALVQAIAQEAGYALVQIAPAQFEEMGDLLGMPAIEANRTVFRPPAWVPQAPGPGILLLDDFNRADDRILRGLMPLLQERQLLSWVLPPRWQILLTANPDDGSYSVTPLDPAIQSRMLHVQLIFDPPVWARWAASAGIDGRGLQFILQHADQLGEWSTSPRAWTQFFTQLPEIPDLQAALPLVYLLAQATLSPAAAEAFIAFVQTEQEDLLDPGEWLEVDRLGLAALTRLLGQPRQAQQAWAERLCGYLAQEKRSLPSNALRKLQELLAWEVLALDLRLGLLQQLQGLPNDLGKKVLQDPQVAQLWLAAALG